MLLDRLVSRTALRLSRGRPLLSGDANLDGSVNATDLNTVGLGWQQIVAGWSAGDFTADGSVTAGDLNLLALNWQETVPPAAAANAVPEPATRAWLILGLLLHLWRKMRQAE